MKKSAESLTRHNYQQLLEVIGKNPYPLSAYQIAKKLGNTGSKYVYEMVEKHLCDHYELYITITPDTNDTQDLKREEKVNLATILNGVYDLNFPLINKGALLIHRGLQFPYVDYKQLDFISDSVKGTITIIFGTTSSVTIGTREEKNGDFTVVPITIKKKNKTQLNNGSTDSTVRDNEEEEAIPDYKHCKRSRGRLFIYLHQSRIEDWMPAVSYLTKHLDLELTKQNLERYSERVRMYRDSPISTIDDGLPFTETGNLRYSLNIRGLILLILGKIRLVDEKKGGGRAQNVRILNVLQNLSIHYANKFPFLLYFDDFRDEYKLLEKDHKVKQNFIVSLVKEIAEELRFQVHAARDDEHLKYWFIRRFSSGITFYLVTNIMNGWLDPDKDLKFLSFAKIRNYQLLNLKAMTEILESEYHNLRGHYEELDSSNFELRFYY